MLRDAVHLGITPYGPDQGWTIGVPIDLGARCKTLHPLVFGPFGDFPLWIRWGGVHGVCPLAGPGPKLPRAMNSTPFGGGSTPALPLTWFGHVGAYGPMLRGPPAHPFWGPSIPGAGDGELPKAALVSGACEWVNLKTCVAFLYYVEPRQVLWWHV